MGPGSERPLLHPRVYGADWGRCAGADVATSTGAAAPKEASMKLNGAEAGRGGDGGMPTARSVGLLTEVSGWGGMLWRFSSGGGH